MSHLIGPSICNALKTWYKIGMFVNKIHSKPRRFLRWGMYIRTITILLQSHFNGSTFYSLDIFATWDEICDFQPPSKFDGRFFCLYIRHTISGPYGFRKYGFTTRTRYFKSNIHKRTSTHTPNFGTTGWDLRLLAE